MSLAKVGMGDNFAAVVLPTLLPKAPALELLYTGRVLTPSEAMHHGFFNAVVAPDHLRPAIKTTVAQIAANAPLSLQRIKAMTSQLQGLPLASVLRLNVGPDPYGSEDRREGMRAFQEKRPPRFCRR
jgi:enoyl-CoA hydratase